DIIFINNKPFFKTHSYIKFSISHSHGHIAILISKSQSINNLGIDIEIFNKKSDRIIQKYGSSSEIKWYFKKNNLSQRKKFYISWCSKEAFLKAYGIGVSHLLEISFIPNKKIFSSSIGKGKIKSFEYKNIFISIFINSSIKDEINNITSYNFQSDKFRKIKESKFQLNYKVNSIKIL
ncbi:MAG: 4'-phosphopantetheinyl transferase superfamily protein, partial [Psittacicella sp.]